MIHLRLEPKTGEVQPYVPVGDHIELSLPSREYNSIRSKYCIRDHHTRIDISRYVVIECRKNVFLEFMGGTSGPKNRYVTYRNFDLWSMTRDQP
jgi:hypothetical protein